MKWTEESVMAENGAAIPELTQMGQDAEQVATLYPRSLPPKPRDIYVPDLHIDSIKVKTRDFR